MPRHMASIPANAAEPLALRGLRVRLRDWLQELGAAASDRTDLELAVWEAAVNAIVHGRPPAGDATVKVRASLDDTGRAVIQVIDRGRWRPPGSADPGRAWPGGQGLSVIRQATDELDVAPGPAGTTVTMRRALSRPVQGEAQPGDYPATAAHHHLSGARPWRPWRVSWRGAALDRRPRAVRGPQVPEEQRELILR